MMKQRIFKAIQTATLLLAISGTAAHACTLPKSYYKNVSCTATAGVYLAAKDDGAPVALLDNKGRVIANLFAYQDALGAQMSSGLLPVVKNGKVGYINKTGKVVIGFHYDKLTQGGWARAAQDGRIVVRKNGAWGIIDTRGKVIVAFDRTISHISDFAHGTATISKGAHSYQIDRSGKRITTDQTVSHRDTPVATPPIQTQTQTQPNQRTNHQPQMPQGAAGFRPHTQDGKWGFVDARGVTMIVYAFDEVRPYSENMAAVRLGERWGFINAAGDLVIDFRFENSGISTVNATPSTPSEPLIFTHGKAWIGNLTDGTKMCINTRGDAVAC